VRGIATAGSGARMWKYALAIAGAFVGPTATIILMSVVLR
jgi:hypothetical protein